MNGEFTDLTTVAAQNIAKAIGAADEHIVHIKQAIADEVHALEAHFAIAVTDAHASFQAEQKRMADDYNLALDDIKGVFSYAEANWGKILLGAGVVLFVGALVGHVL